MHELEIIHRDIKPKNLMARKNKLFVIGKEQKIRFSLIIAKEKFFFAFLI